MPTTEGTPGRRAMKGLAVALLGLCVLGSGGCPHAFKHPLGPVQRASVDPKLLAVWNCRVGEDESFKLSIMDYDGRQYVLYGVAEGEPPGFLRAYSTRVGGQWFLNVHEIEAAAVAEPAWMFASYEMVAPGELTLRWVALAPFENVSDNAKKVRRLLERNLDNPDFFDSTWTCVEAKPEDGCE